MQIRIRTLLVILMRIESCLSLDADPDPDPSFQIKAQSLEKVLKQAHIPYIMVCHLHIDADPDPDPAYHVDADADPDPTF